MGGGAGVSKLFYYEIGGRGGAGGGARVSDFFLQRSQI